MAESYLKPLTGRTIVIAQPDDHTAELTIELEQLGAQVLICPDVAITALDTYERLDESLDHLYGYDWVLFTTPQAVSHFLDRMEVLGLELNKLDDLRVCAVGGATEALLIERHLHVDLVPEKTANKTVLTAIEQFLGGNAELAGLNFLLPRALDTRDYLSRTLLEAGARVDVVTSYRVQIDDHPDRGRLTALMFGGADCIVFTSPSAVENVGRLFDTQDLTELLAGIAVVCENEATVQSAGDFGLQAHVAATSIVAAVTQALADHSAN